MIRNCRYALIAASAVAFSPCRAEALRIPAFARQYRTGCSTCHVAPPKLNVLGEAFRLNGYRMPENAALLRKEPPVPLGEEPWEDLWPRAIYPGEAPGTAPFALRITSALVAQQNSGRNPSFSMRMPEDVYLMAGSSLGTGIGAMMVAEWDREDGFAVRQAKVLFQDVIPALPARALNLSVGLQNLYLLTSGDRQIDRATIRAFSWQGFSWSQVPLRTAPGAGSRTSSASFSLANAQPAVVLNGLLGGRTFYSVGLTQGTTNTTTDENNVKDLFYTVRHKWGGLGLDGKYERGHGPPGGSYGQLHDRAVILEHFGYFGREPTDSGASSRIEAYGAAARVLYRRTDVAVGAVRRSDDDPWGVAIPARMSSVFARGEYLLYPWLIASLKVERFAVAADGEEGQTSPAGAAVVSPGVVMLLRQNVRLVVEGDVYRRHDASRMSGSGRPNRLTARLDLSY